ncbi:hypothetical protein [Streptomyces sp. NPDC046371]|uniref:hypothetical protein n=1 Tax=unclassified Streptomyces TaxID=2593676 RepID=UPI003400E3DE
MRDLTGLERNPWINVLAYYRCPGRGAGLAEEGEAYELSSATQLKVTDDRRHEVLRALREKLADEGFEVTPDESGSAGGSTSSTSPAGDFEAVHKPDPYSISLRGETEAGQDGGVVVTVTLPCQAPPTGAAAHAPAARS